MRYLRITPHSSWQHTLVIQMETLRDRLLEWATNSKFKDERVRHVRMQTMGRNAVKLNIPGSVDYDHDNEASKCVQKDLSEPADGAQFMVFFFRSLYDLLGRSQAAVAICPLGWQAAHSV
jgi:hypothetical protein